jgi:outer membrane lipoprotein-sorting protein
MSRKGGIALRKYRGVFALIALIAIITGVSTRLKADTGTCSGQMLTLPFTDVSAGSIFFCAIAEAYFSGLTVGTTATTYGPGEVVSREQMAAFVTRTLDQSLRRGARRSALKRFYIPTSADGLGLTSIGSMANLVVSDGADLWVANRGSNSVSRVRASDGKLLETWSAATLPIGVLAAKGSVFVTGDTGPGGSLYQIDPSQPVGPVTTLSTALGSNPQGIAFDGARVWTANEGGSVSLIVLTPLTVTNVSTGFVGPIGIVFDGSNMWVTDRGTFPGKLFKLDSVGNIAQTITVDQSPAFPAFDGTNIWVPNFISNTVTVVRASTGTVLATLTGNGLNGPNEAAFDGERILITNFNGSSVSIWKAADLTPIATVTTGSNSFPVGACSDGLNFWITLQGGGKLARF